MPKEQKSKRLKKEAATLPSPPDNPRQCHFWVKRKRQVNKLNERFIRYCHLPTKIGNNYCGEHLASDPNPTTRERIPCPYDKSHTVYKDELEKHLAQKCNSRPRPNPPYFSLNFNCTLSSPSKFAEEGKITLSELSKEILDSLINNVNYWFQKFVPTNFKSLVLDHEVLKEKKEIITNSKHVIQQASLLGHMERLKLLQPDGCFIEFGCGKGELSYFTKFAIKDKDDGVRFLLIDRKNTRGKFDAGIREDKSSTNKESLVLRIGIDIKDLDLSKLDFVKDKKIIAYSKHLCGSATDVTLKSLVNYSKSNKENPVIGIIIALCCHQLCQYHMYPNHQYLEDIGITKDDFQRICTMSSWAICLDHSSRETLGYKCKRILDYGRLKYLQENGFDVELIYYVEPSTSLENLALMAVPKKD
ncbi:9679_t:CDS:10 [Cetraspora pellucida]|uniref:9679_t:CDS:1 n=1 Tax=Cetraspora pellucida TaxID=1433469 RepID=A0ACA9K6B3_9GLOM|nr:9679_t:CDS:10 [Cetraspora pellucida]